MRKIITAALGASMALGASQASAYLVSFGEDLNNSASTPLADTPNANSAESSFLSNLVGVGTETFEDKTTDESDPLDLTFPGAGTATLSGGNGSVKSVTPGTTDGNGRYSVASESTSKYWEVAAGGSGNFRVDFTQSVAAFGFYGIDIGDFGGQLNLKLSNGNELTVNNTIGSSGSTDGSVLFFGLIAQSPAEEFTSVDFLTTTGTGDYFAFDNFTIGSREQVTSSVPEPGTLALLGVGLAGLGLTRRKRSAQ